MRNLAGNEDCDLYIRDELEAVGISPMPVARSNTEVPYSIVGRFGEMIFTRNWYYWVVKGSVPLAAAREMYEDAVGRRDVRVAGHCGCPHPDEWARIQGDKLDDEEFLASKYKELGFNKFKEWIAPLEKKYNVTKQNMLSSDNIDGLVVDSYHIDSLEGLQLFVNIIRKYKLV